MKRHTIRFAHLFFTIPWVCSLLAGCGVENTEKSPTQKPSARSAPEKQTAAMPSLTNGTPRSEVITLLGPPKGTMEGRGTTVLVYDGGSVTLTSNRVSGTRWKTPEEIKQADALRNKQPNKAADRRLSKKQVDLFTASVQRDQGEYTRLELERRPLSNKLTSRKRDYKYQYDSMLRYKSRCERSSGGSPRPYSHSYQGCNYRNYLSAKNRVDQLHDEIEQIEKKLELIQSRQRKLRSSINANKIFLKRHHEQEEQEKSSPFKLW